ncbi:MAG: class I SAM-dependent methyltransferase [Deltaproteobacteria bacterium]|nr:class I SAM-dependent methyltransferase [Deltaproteobacteria bacterium]
MTKVDSFDKNVEKYESWFERNSLAYESELEAVKALFPEHGKGLEIGVGTGLFAAPLGVRFGLDPSKNMSQVAMKGGVKVILGTGENLPCKDGSFDIVLMVTTVCFLDDVVRTLNEAHRVLKNSGYIVIGFIDRESFLGRIYEIRKMDNLFYKDATFLSIKEVISYLKQAGFRDFLFRQTIFGNTAEMKGPDPVKPGYGEGSFVVVRGKKLH